MLFYWYNRFMKRLIEIYGWYGVGAVIVAYILVIFSIIRPESSWYSALNITGAVGIAIHSFYKHDYQAIVVNIIWAVITLTAILKFTVY